MVDKTSEDVRQTIDSLAPYPRLLRGIWEALGIKTGEEKDVQSRKQRKGSLTTLLEDYQVSLFFFHIGKSKSLSCLQYHRPLSSM